MKKTIIELQSNKFIMPKRLVSLINRFATPVGYHYGYVSNSNCDSKSFFYKETKQFARFIDTEMIADNSKQANEMKINYENMCKGTMYDTMKKELDEARLQIKDLQENKVAEPANKK